MKKEIKSDVFDIVKRLKQIDDGYFVLFDTEKQKFELHNLFQPNTTYCLTLPFEFLDERTIHLTLKTLRKNQNDLFEEMERQNQKFEGNAFANFKRSFYVG